MHALMHACMRGKKKQVSPRRRFGIRSTAHIARFFVRVRKNREHKSITVQHKVPISKFNSIVLVIKGFVSYTARREWGGGGGGGAGGNAQHQGCWLVSAQALSGWSPARRRYVNVSVTLFCRHVRALLPAY